MDCSALASNSKTTIRLDNNFLAPKEYSLARCSGVKLKCSSWFSYWSPPTTHPHTPPTPHTHTLQVKILPNKQGTAMAHIDNQDSAKNAIQHLHGRKLMGSNLELKWDLLHTHTHTHTQQCGVKQTLHLLHMWQGLGKQPLWSKLINCILLLN